MATRSLLIRKVPAHVSAKVSLSWMVVLTNWTAHQQSKKAPNDKNFSMLNKLAINSKATTPRKQYDFRQSVNVRLRDAQHRREFIPQISADENTAFGNPNRPSTPIKAVVEGFFGDVAAQQTLERYDSISKRG
jgi:hypothetical protein